MNTQSKAADFDDFADDYSETINKVSKLSGEKFEYFVNLRVKMMKDRLVRYDALIEDGTILDFGCGTGGTETALIKAFPLATIHAIDQSAESIRIAQKRSLNNVSLCSYGGARLPFADASFDLIYMIGVMHHVPLNERQSVLLELHRVLKRGGNLFVFENNPWNPLMLRAMANNPMDAGVKAIRSLDICKLGHWSGFSIVEAWYYFFFPNFLRFLRRAEKKMGWLPVGAQYATWMQK